MVQSGLLGCGLRKFVVEVEENQQVEGINGY
jgi:hypothetical protein